MRLPNAQNCCRDLVANVSITPFHLHVDQGPDVVFQDKKPTTDEVESSEPRLTRRLYTKKVDYDNYGYTSGCPRCEHEVKYGPGRTTKPHSERCRSRIMEELSKTEIGRARLGFATERMDRSLAEHVEYHDDRKARVQGEKVDDVPSVPLRDPFQHFRTIAGQRRWNGRSIASVVPRTHGCA